MVKLVLVTVQIHVCNRQATRLEKDYVEEEGENKKGKDVSVSEEAARGLLKGSLGSDH